MKNTMSREYRAELSRLRKALSKVEGRKTKAGKAAKTACGLLDKSYEKAKAEIFRLNKIEETGAGKTAAALGRRIAILEGRES